MPNQNAALEGFTLQQIGALIGRLPPDQQLSFVRELRRRYGLTYEIPAQPAWERDEFTELLFQGRCVRFQQSAIAAAAGNCSGLEVGNGVANPTGKAILLKRAIITSPVAAIYELRLTTQGFQTVSVVGPASMRTPSLAISSAVLGSFPVTGQFLGGNGEANGRSGNVLAATLAANTILHARYAVGANQTLVVDVPSSYLCALMDSSGSVGVAGIYCATVNQTFDCTLEIAQVDINSY